MHIKSIKMNIEESAKQTSVSYISAVSSLHGIANQIYHEEGNQTYLNDSVGHVEKYFYINKLSRYLLYNRYLESIIILKDGRTYVVGQKGLLPDAAEYINENCDIKLPKLCRAEDYHSGEIADSAAMPYFYTFIYYETQDVPQCRRKQQNC